MDGDLPAAAADRLLDQLAGLPMVYGAVPALEPHRLAFRYGVCIDAVYHLPATYALASRWLDDRVVGAAGGRRRCRQHAGAALRHRVGAVVRPDPQAQQRRRLDPRVGMGGARPARLGAHSCDGRNTRRGRRSRRRGAGAVGRDADGGRQLGRGAVPHAGRGRDLDRLVLRRRRIASGGGLDRRTPASTCSSWPPKPAGERVDDDGTYTGVTTDVLPSWDITTYENCPTEPSPWAQGAAVRAFAALARTRSGEEVVEVGVAELAARVPLRHQPLERSQLRNSLTKRDAAHRRQLAPVRSGANGASASSTWRSTGSTSGQDGIQVKWKAMQSRW